MQCDLKSFMLIFNYDRYKWHGSEKMPVTLYVAYMFNVIYCLLKIVSDLFALFMVA